MTEKPKAFLLVISRTHYRVMMGVADMLQASGEFVPHVVYYPSRVYDENFLGCMDKPYVAHLFSGKRFVERATIAGRAVNDSGPGAPSERIAIPGHRHVRRLAARTTRAYAGIRLFAARLRDRVFAQGATRAGMSFLAKHLLFLTDLTWRYLVTKSRGEDDLERRNAILGMWADALWQADDGGARRWSEDLVGLLDEQATIFLAFGLLLECERPAVFVMPEENILYNGHAFVRACKDAHVPSVIVPFTISDQKELMGGLYHFPPSHADHGPNRTIADAFPSWSREHRGRRLVIPPPYLLGCEHLGIRYDDPWLINSGPAEAITADSELMSRYYLRAGIRPEKIRFTGALADDVIFEQRSVRDRKRPGFLDAYGVRCARRLLLVAAPPDMFARDHRHLEFHEHAELVRFMVAAAVAACVPGDAVLVSLHPNIDAGSAGWVEGLGATIVREPIEGVLPLCDIFAAVASATIRFAIGAGVPTINFDAFQFDYDDYRGLGGVLTARTRRDYEGILHRLLTDDAEFEAVRSAQEETARIEYRVDGNAHRRMLALFAELAARH